MPVCRPQIEELLDDPEIDVVYNPVSRLFFSILNDAAQALCFIAAKWSPL